MSQSVVCECRQRIEIVMVWFHESNISFDRIHCKWKLHEAWQIKKDLNEAWFVHISMIQKKIEMKWQCHYGFRYAVSNDMLVQVVQYFSFLLRQFNTFTSWWTLNSNWESKVQISLVINTENQTSRLWHSYDYSFSFQLIKLLFHLEN